MSTRVGTLHAPKIGRPIWAAAVVAAFVMLTVGVIAVSVDRDQTRSNTPAVAGRVVVNTPSELSAGLGGKGIDRDLLGGTAANTPTELSGGFRGHGFVRPKFGRGPAKNAPSVVDGLGTNTPSEISGGGVAAEIYDRHQRG